MPFYPDFRPFFSNRLLVFSIVYVLQVYVLLSHFLSPGDLHVQKTSRKCLETIIFLILYDSIYGKTPGFCSISFECGVHSGAGNAKTVKLVIKKSSDSRYYTRHESDLVSSEGTAPHLC